MRSISALAARPRSVSVRPGFAEAAGFREDGVGFAIHFLQQKIQLLAGFAFGGKQGVGLIGMRFQTDQFLADIAALGQNRRFLREARGVDLRAVEHFAQPVAQPLLKERERAAADLFHAADQFAQRSGAHADFGFDGLAFAHAERVQFVDGFGGRGQRFGFERLADRGFASVAAALRSCPAGAAPD